MFSLSLQNLFMNFSVRFKARHHKLPNLVFRFIVYESGRKAKIKTTIGLVNRLLLRSSYDDASYFPPK